MRMRKFLSIALLLLCGLSILPAKANAALYEWYQLYTNDTFTNYLSGDNFTLAGTADWTAHGTNGGCLNFCTNSTEGTWNGLLHSQAESSPWTGPYQVDWADLGIKCNSGNAPPNTITHKTIMGGHTMMAKATVGTHTIWRIIIETHDDTQEVGGWYHCATYEQRDNNGNPLYDQDPDAAGIGLFERIDGTTYSECVGPASIYVAGVP